MKLHSVLANADSARNVQLHVQYRWLGCLAAEAVAGDGYRGREAVKQVRFRVVARRVAVRPDDAKNRSD